MASQDPFEGVDPTLIELVQARFGTRTPDGPIDEEIQNMVLRRFGLEGETPGFLERAEGVGRTLASLLPSGPAPSPEVAGRQAAALAGMAKGAILDPLQGVVGASGVAADFAGDVLERMGVEEGKGFLGAAMGGLGRVESLSDSAVDFLIRSREQIFTEAEALAMDAGGLDRFQIADAYSVGDLLGMTAPIAGSLKGAQAILRVPKTASAAVPSLQVDATAGLLFGGLLRPGDTVGDRLKHMGEEAAFFLAFKTILTGAALPIKVWRSRRLRSMRVSKELEKFLQAKMRGEEPEMTEGVAKNLMNLLGEEDLIINSPQARDLLERGLPERALVRGVIDSADGSRGMVQGIEGTLPEVEGMVSKFREELPGLKFDVLKAGEGQWAVTFSTKGLNNKQRSQWKRFQMFEGQKIEKNGSIYTLVDPEPSKTGFIKVRTDEGKIVALKNENLTPRRQFVEEVDIPPVGEALFSDYREFVDEVHRKILQFGDGLSEEEIIRGLREGTLNISDKMRRNLNLPGTVVYPEESGLRPQGLAMEAGAPGDHAGEKLMEAASRVAGKGPTDPVAVVSFERGAASPFIEQAARVRAHRDPSGVWKLTYFDAEERVLGGRPFETLEEALQAAEAEGWVQKQVRLQTPTVQETVEDIARRGSDGGTILTPQATVTTDDLFDAWIRERGLPEGAGDRRALQEFFNSKLKRDLWKTVPPEDRAVFESVRDELLEAAARGEIPLGSLAHTKGFRLLREPEGVVLQDLNTGARFRAAGEREAREALLAVQRDGQELVPDLIPWDSRGIMNISQGFPKPETVWSLEEHVPLKDWFNEIEHAMLGKFSKNISDLLVRIEDVTGMPLWSEGFDKIDTGLQSLRVTLEPLAKEVQKMWKGISREQKDRIVQFWTSVEGEDIPLAQTAKMMKDQGFSSREIIAFERARTMFDYLYQIGSEAGIFKRGQYIKNYYTRVRPFVEKHGYADMDQIFGVGNVPPEFKFWAEMSRTGELAMIETDPEIVMHKYLYRLLWKRDVYPHWNKLADLAGTTQRAPMKIADLPSEVQQRLLSANPDARPDHTVLPDPLIKTIQEYLNTVRGAPVDGFRTMNKKTRIFLERLGLKVDERLFEEFHNIILAHLYGGAMAARPYLVFRNSIQNYWMMQSRIGSRHASGAFEKALSQEGFDEVLDAGAIRMAEAGIPQMDAWVRQFLDSPETVQGTGPLSRALASTIRLGLRTGQVSKKAAQKLLVPYSTQDQANRAWAYFWQKDFTNEWLQKYEAGKIGWDKFLEEGLSFFADPKKQKFAQRYKRLGREDALRFIGKQAADETNFIYQAGTQPMALQGPFGRLFGMFGTWPVWAIELYMRRFKLGTPKQKAAFVTRTATVAGAFALVGLETGRDLFSWMAPPSVMFTGGPFTDHVEDLRALIDAPVDQKAGAARRLATNVGRLWYPGQLALKDINEILDHEDPREAALTMMLGAPVRKGNFAFDWVYNRDIPVSSAPFRMNAPSVRPLTGEPLPLGGPAGRRSAGERVRISEPPDFSSFRGNM